MFDYNRLTKWEVPNCASVNGVSPIDKDIANAINRLAELEDLIEQELLIKLPCKVGDMVWEVNPFDKITLPIIAPNLYAIIRWTEDKAFGKYLFLTKAEAEARVEEIKRRRNND